MVCGQYSVTMTCLDNSSSCRSMFLAFIFVPLLLSRRLFTTLVFNAAGELLLRVVECRSEKDFTATTEIITLLDEEQL